ncbi:MAG: DUF481 domain-containing protein [Verrucomicrobiota bacterium]
MAGRAEDSEKPWDRSIAAGVAVTTGNSDSLQFNAGVKGNKIWKFDELRLSLGGTYGKNDGTVANQQLLGLAQYKHLFTERFYGTVVASGLNDAIANIDYRFTVGPGLGYYFIKTDTTQLSADAGPSMVFEKTDVYHPNFAAANPLSPTLWTTSEERSYLAARVGERFDRKLSDTAKCWQQSEFLPQIDNFSNYLLNTEAGVEAALTKTMSLRLVGTHRYQSITQDNSRHYDITVVSALAYKF